MGPISHRGAMPTNPLLAPVPAGLGFFSGFFVLFFHLTKNLGHVIHLVPDSLADEDRRFLLGGERDAIARPCVQFDNFALLDLVLDNQNQPPEVGAAFEVVDHDPFDLCAKRLKNEREEVVGERAFLFRAA